MFTSDSDSSGQHVFSRAAFCSWRGLAIPDLAVDLLTTRPSEPPPGIRIRMRMLAYSADPWLRMRLLDKEKAAVSVRPVRKPETSCGLRAVPGPGHYGKNGPHRAKKGLPS